MLVNGHNARAQIGVKASELLVSPDMELWIKKKFGQPLNFTQSQILSFNICGEKKQHLLCFKKCVSLVKKLFELFVVYKKKNNKLNSCPG